jgi:hypothetical protein
MNKKVSSHLAVIIILVIAAAVGAYAWVKSNSINAESGPATQVTVAKNQTDACKAHAYEGKADVWVWQAGKGILEVASSDLAKLPTDKNTEFQLADMTPDLQKKLAASSESDPVTVTVTGFMTRCNNQTAVAVQNYKDGVFKPFL